MMFVLKQLKYNDYKKLVGDLMGFFNKIKNTIKSNDNSFKKEENSEDRKDNQHIEKIKHKSKSDSTLNYNENFNFKYLDDLIHSSKTEIILDTDIILQDNEISKYSDGIFINKNLIIDGKNHFIDAKSKVHFFNIADCNIIFKNIIFKNASHEKSYDSDGNSGDIHNDKGNIFFENCEFLNNHQAVYNYHGSLTFKNCQFNENDNSAINNTGGSLTIKDCRFTGNKTDIYNHTDLKSKIENSIFEKNSGRTINNAKGSILILNSIFRDNLLCSGANGIIYNDNQFSDEKHTLKLIDCFFENNIVKSSKDKFESLGGAIYNKSILFCDNCIFNNNYAFAGAAICNENSYINIVNSKFTNNKSKYGAVIYQYREDSNLTIENSQFYESSTDENIIYSEHGFCSVKNSKFETNNLNSKGYAIYNSHSSLTIEKSKFYDKNNNKPIFNDHILKISKDDKIEDKIESGNHAKPLEYLRSGINENLKGFYYLDEIIQKELNEIYLEYDILMQDAEQDFFEGGIEINKDNITIDGQGHTINANKLSRIFYITANNVTLRNIKFINGKYVKNKMDTKNNGGGAICCLHNTSLTIIGCEFIENDSRESAGAICSKGDLNLVEKCKFIKNHSQGYGTIYIDFGSINLLNCEFNENNCGYGGAVYINKANLKSENCNFNNNSAVLQGGVINAENGQLEFHSCSFNNNTSNQGVGGGAIANNNATVKISDCKFENNYGFYGGAINNGHKGVVNINHCCFGENYAITKTSESINKSPDKYLSLIDSHGRNFEDSIYQSLGKGGAIFNKGNVKLFDSTFNGKEGDILFNKGNIEISACVFKSYHSIKNEGKLIEGEGNIIK